MDQKSTLRLGGFSNPEGRGGRRKQSNKRPRGKKSEVRSQNSEKKEKEDFSASRIQYLFFLSFFLANPAISAVCFLEFKK
jgi:hypothetical protein